MQVAALFDLVLLAGTALALTDPEAGGFALATALFIGLLRFRNGTLGVVLLGLLFADVTYWMAGGAVDNLRHGEGLWETAVPSALAVASVAGIVGVVGAFVRRGDRAARGVGVIAVAVFALIVVAALVGADGGEAPQRDEIALETKDVRFSDTSLAAPAGEITVAVSNKDLFWHTFTIPDLGVNVSLPVGADRRETFDAPAGSYEFICAIGPHQSLGMKGTLTVR